MFNQHAKWLKVTRDIPWRRPIASLNYLLSSHVWRQDHNGFSHQDPGFIDHVVNKKAEIIRVYLPPDANCLLSVADHCLRSRDYVNVIVAGKQPALDYLPMDEAIAHCTRGLGIWDWAGTERRGRGARRRARRAPATSPRWRPSRPRRSCASSCPTCAVRVVNVVDLMRLQSGVGAPARARRTPSSTRCSPPAGRSIFAYHGYPWLIHRLTYRRNNHGNLHVRGYKEEGTTTTPFDMVMLNDMDRYHLVMDVIDRVPGLGARASPGCARRWSTSAFGCASTRASTATTRPRCATGRMPGAAQRSPVRVLTVNTGSSSVKLRLLGDDDELLAEDEPEAAGRAIDTGALARRSSGWATPTRSRTASSTGAERTEAARLDAARSRELERLTPLAPAASAQGARGGRAVARRAGRTCRPSRASTRRSTRTCRRPPPRMRCRRHGGSASALRRYGFHGLSHAYAARRAAELLGLDAGARIVTCHLGAGASLAAVRDGRSLDTTMGFTPLEGIVMATRSGSVDPGLVLWLVRQGLAPGEVQEALEQHSGLLGARGHRRHARGARTRRRRCAARARRLPAPSGRRRRGDGRRARRARRARLHRRSRESARARSARVRPSGSPSSAWNWTRPATAPRRRRGHLGERRSHARGGRGTGGPRDGTAGTRGARELSLRGLQEGDSGGRAREMTRPPPYPAGAPERRPASHHASGPSSTRPDHR